MKIYLGSDHAGFELKEEMKAYLQDHNYEVEDCGALTFDQTDDYPDLIVIAAQKVAQTPGSKGVVFGKSGAGEAIVANKVNGIRAFLGFSEDNVLLAREHNDANILSLGSAFVTPDLGKKLVQLFLDTPFTAEERHKRRIEKISELEKNQ
ncbi:MAG TPA: RpiB/LacA/LacB family sugar-phosphate isomerase [Candidatus Saccharimonadales bacterium]|nr:RpiB/LacA/LacB family sugar-phosphate isomerase [Candidatus Saccharimonadales bacterium]